MNRLAILMAVVVMVAGLLGGCAAVDQGSAQTALASGRLDEAAADIQAALAHDPDNLQLKHLAAEIFTRRGVKYYQQGAMIAASDDFHRAVDYYPTYAMAYDYLGMIAFQHHNWQDAIRYGSKAAGLQGKPDPGYVQMAREELRKLQSGGFRPHGQARGRGTNYSY
jgi:tetratricopeptide (TPR) repeat protein